MNKNFALLPCNGLDKTAGQVAREIAIRLSEETESEIICPVFSRVADVKYKELAENKPLLVIDGCATRCAGKLAQEKGLKIAQRLVITEERKKHGLQPGPSLRIAGDDQRLVDLILADILKAEEEKAEEKGTSDFPENYQYNIHTKDKFIFRVPNEGFLFNGNDCWAYVAGNKARIGVTDFVQQRLSDILFFTPPAVGAEIEQFGEAGEIESGKAVFEIISPVSGIVTAVNEKLSNAPELINENPYELGWIAELELTDLEGDKELLMDAGQYMELLKEKVEEIHAKEG